MSGAASGLIEALQLNNPGSDWEQIPIGTASWFMYGAGGISSWGSLCGVPNGCCVVLNMLGLTAKGAEVLGYYSETVFPTSAVPDVWDSSWQTPEPIPHGDVLAETEALSPLCHVSISKWCDAAGVNLKATDAQSRVYKNDRCGKICADMAAFTAELINGSTYVYGVPNKTAECIVCHNAASPPGTPAQAGKMDCAGCHTKDAVIVHPRHPR